MKEHLDKLSKNLASGMSRRQALRLFFTGIGAAAVGLVSGSSPKADGNEICVELCRAQELRGRDFGECVAESAKCPPGMCACCFSGSCQCVPVEVVIDRCG